VGYDESDYQRELEEQALEEMFRDWLPEALWERQAEAAAKYLQTFGDAPYERVLRCLDDGRSLLAAGHHEAALSRAFTAIELMVGHLLFRPLFMGVFLSEEIAARIVQEIINGKGEKERILVPTVLKHWNIDVERLRLPDGTPLWSAVTDPIRLKRNAVVHEGAQASESEASNAVAAAELLLEEVVYSLAKELGFTLKETGKWSEIQRYTTTKHYPTKSPFKDK
jgi:hypothetical protein